MARESELGALFVDLTHWVETATGGPGLSAAGGMPAPRGAGLSGAPAPRASRVARVPVASVRPAPPVPAPPARAPAAPPVAEASSRPSSAPALEVLPSEAAGATEPGSRDDAAPGLAGASGVPSGGGSASAGAGVLGGSWARGGAVGTGPDVSHGLALAEPGTGAGSGAPGAEYGPYLARLRQRAQQSLRYPFAARRRGLEGTVALDILIRPDGTFGVVAVADSSSHAVLDDAALETVRSLAPEPFPPGVARRVLRVRLPVVFTLR